jgi:3-hydroxyacyl-[acyl-carrier-protein] dehydratase
VLREAKGVKYGTFMEPGRQMAVSVELVERGNGVADFKGKGEMEGQSTVSARLVLAYYNLGDHDPTLRKMDERLIQHFRELYGLLRLR